MPKYICEISASSWFYYKEIYYGARSHERKMFQPTLVQKFSRIKVFNTLAVPILLYGSEIGPLEKRTKKIDVNRDEHKRNE